MVVRTRSDENAEVNGMSEYEKLRLANIRRNEAHLASLGLATGGLEKKKKAPARAKKRKRLVPEVEPRRSTRNKGLPPAEIKIPEEPPRDRATREVDNGDDAQDIARDIIIRRDIPRPKNGERYMSSLRSLRLAGVEKTSRGGKGYALAFHPTSAKLFVASGDAGGQVGIWNVDDGTSYEFEYHARAVSALSWDGDRLCSAGYDGLARRLDLVRGVVETLVDYEKFSELEGNLVHAAFVDLGVLAAHDDGTCSLVDPLSGGSLAWSFEAHGAKAAHVAWRGDGAFATSGNDGKVRLWDARRLGVPVWEASHAKAVRGCTFAPDGGAALASISYDNTVRIYYEGESKILDRCVRVAHDNCTGRYLTPFKPVFDPHAPHPTLVLGSMDKPRRVDVVQPPRATTDCGDGAVFPLGAALVHTLRDDDNFRAITSIHDVHPTRHVIAGINNSARVSVWRSFDEEKDDDGAARASRGD